MINIYTQLKLTLYLVRCRIFVVTLVLLYYNLNNKSDSVNPK
jgi:hypothetical protein